LEKKLADIEENLQIVENNYDNLSKFKK